MKVVGTNIVTRITVEAKTYPARVGPRSWTSLAIGRDNKYCDTHYGAIYIVTKMDDGGMVNGDVLALLQAAPELRDALKALVDQVAKHTDDHGHPMRNLKPLIEARAVLAKVGL